MTYRMKMRIQIGEDYMSALRDILTALTLDIVIGQPVQGTANCLCPC